jgi:hypothetical protein
MTWRIYSWPDAGYLLLIPDFLDRSQVRSRVATVIREETMQEAKTNAQSGEDLVIDEQNIPYKMDSGFKVPVMGSWNEPEDENVGRITPDSIKEVVLTLGQSDFVDTVFISCTSVRALEIIKAAEEELGKPVVSSNLVLGWHCLRLAGVNDRLPRFGSLFEKTL